MAISEACQLWIEQRIEEELEEQSETGKSLRAIGRELAKEIEKIFKAKVNPNTLRVKAGRIKEQQTGTNVPPITTPQSDNEIQKNQVESGYEWNPDKNQWKPQQAEPPQHGGKRDGSGRPIKHRPTQEEKEKIVTDEFMGSFNQFLSEIKNAKKLKWQHTSREAALKYVGILLDVITIS